MYSREEKLKAVELYIQYDLSPASVINELGYPTVPALKMWHKEYLANGKDFPRKKIYPRFSEEQMRKAVDHFFEHGQCLARTVRALGYPNTDYLSKWVDLLEPNRRIKRASAGKFSDEQRQEAVIDLVTRKSTASEIAGKYNVNSETIYNWRRKFLKLEEVSILKKKKPKTIEELEEYEEQLKQDIERLELRKAILEGTVELLGKDQCADPKTLTNKEKVLLIEHLRSAHKLKTLLDEVGLAKSSYLYQKRAILREDKYECLRKQIRTIFYENNERYGYRRVHAVIKTTQITISEKVICRLMKEEGLVAKRPAKRRYNSYKGEISDAPANIVNRNFHADKPNQLWLTDITEFSILAGKVYLSPIIDCFDGMCVSWTISTHPNAELVNEMFDKALAKLGKNEHPISHSDRGSHYRWPGWIKRCEEHGIVRSMSKKGCSPDNSAMEGFFGRLKVEFFYGRDWSKHSIDSFIDALDSYIRWYNEKRIKVSLGGMSPMQYRQSLGFAA